jgi:hypothetical protein
LGAAYGWLNSLATRVYFHASVLVEGTGSECARANASAAPGQVLACNNGSTVVLGSVIVAVVIACCSSLGRPGGSTLPEYGIPFSDRLIFSSSDHAISFSQS